MSDDDTPDNVRQLPRIGSPPPPPVPPVPDLADDDSTDPGRPGAVRISTFDAPQVATPPPVPGAVPAALRSDSPAAPQTLPPGTGTLSLAAVLAIALAAFEGLQTWIQESGPRRLEAAKHQRELELLVAKAGADSDRLGAAGAAQRRSRVPSSHEFGRGFLGRGSGGPGRAGGGTGSGFRRSGAGPSAGFGSASGRGGTRSGLLGPNRSAAGGRSVRAAGGPGLNGIGPNGGAGTRRGGAGGAGPPGGRRANPGAATGAGAGAGGRGNAGAGAGSSGGGRRTGGGGAGPGGRRSPRQAVTNWWNGRKRTDAAGGTRPGPAGGPGSTGARIRDAVARQKSGPTFWEQVGARVQDRWKKRRTTPTTPAGGAAGTANTVKGTADTNAKDWAPPGDGRRVKFKEAVFIAVRIRWDKRREDWKARGGPRRTPPPRPRKPKPRAGSSRKPRGPRTSTGRKQAPKNTAGAPGPGASDPGFGPRSSAFDTGNGPDVTITVEQVDPPGAHAKRWEPDAITPGPRQLPRQSTPSLPRAPQRPAGTRPGTTRRKDPIPMPASSPRPDTSAAAVAAILPASGSLSGQHATELKLDQALATLTMLTTSGMETHDAAMEVSRQARQLVGAIEEMARDLAENHNMRGPKTLAALAALLESVGVLAVRIERMAKDCMQAAELSEAEEAAMARDHRPLQTAYVDAGAAAPTARIHNEN